MPNTKSAERRVRSSERKRLANRAVKSRLKGLQKKYEGLVKSGNKEETAKALKDISSAFDKAVKAGVVHKATASRKRSRFAIALGKLK
jgi:small subunit ribosomal protein S20